MCKSINKMAIIKREASKQHLSTITQINLSSGYNYMQIPLRKDSYIIPAFFFVSSRFATGILLKVSHSQLQAPCGKSLI